jgi:hypothetical protein
MTPTTTFCDASFQSTGTFPSLPARGTDAVTIMLPAAGVTRTYSFFAAILPYTDAGWERLLISLTSPMPRAVKRRIVEVHARDAG